MEELLSCSTKDVNGVLSLEVWQKTGNRLMVRVLRDGVQLGCKTFKDCETQHYDSERWLQDKVGYPNVYAGVLSNRMWEK